MANTIVLIQEVKVGDTIKHITKHGVFTYKILTISEIKDIPITYKVIFTPHEEVKL